MKGGALRTAAEEHSFGGMEPMRDSRSSALEQVVERFATLLRRVASRYRLQGADVDDLVQEVRIRLWRAQGAGGGSAEEPTAAYVHRVAMTAALDLLRRRRAHKSEVTVSTDFMSDEELGTAGSVRVASPAELLEQREAAARVQSAIGTLPESRRTAVKLYLAGYGREEIAELLGWTEAKTRNLLYRGLHDLRERLTAQGIGQGGP